jgi:hypothetical protein
MRKELKLVLAAGALLVLAATSRAQSGAFFQAVTNLNPLGYWPLNETTAPPGSKPNALNFGSLADNGTYSDGAFPGVPGALAGDADTGGLFSGASGLNPKVQVPYDPSYAGLTAFTVEFWVNSPVDPGYLYAATYAPQYPSPVNCMDTASPNAGWVVYEGLNGTPGTFNFQTFNQNGTTPSLNLQLNVPPALLDGSGHMFSNTWYYVAVTFNGTAATGYINGQQVATGTASGYVPAASTGLAIGNRSDGGFSFPGSMDEVALYSSVLSAANILAHYQAATNPAPATAYHTLVASQNPLLYYRLDDAAAPVANSYGTLGALLNGYYETGTSPGAVGPAFSGFGPNSYACTFNGLGASVSIPNAMALLNLGDINGLVPGPIQSVTLASWVMVPPTVSSFQTVAGSGDAEYRFNVENSGLPHFAVGFNGDDAIGNSAVNDGQWHFWVGVWDQATGDQSLYIDGRLSGSSSGQPGGGPEGEPFLIGNAPDYSDRNFMGSVAQVALFGNSLTAGQIQNLYYASGAPPVITAQPQPTVAMQGSNVSLTVSASGKPALSYQWYTGTPGSGTPVSGGNLSGANTSTLTFTAAQPANNGEYYVVVTDGNASTVTSVGVTLSIRTTALAGSYFPAVIGLNPLGYWPLNETTPPPAANVATNYGTLGASGYAAYSANGVINQWPGGGLGLTPDGDAAIHTDGSAGIVTLPFSSALSLGAPFSAEAWLSSGNPSTIGCALACMDANNPRSGWLVYVDGANPGSYNFRMYNQNGGNTSLSISSTANEINAGQWYHVVVVYDGTQGYIYINGQLANSGTPSGFVANDAGALTIGARSDNSFYFIGGEADVAVYTNALSAATILAHYTAGTNNATASTAYRDLVLQSHPLVFYRLDEPTYTAPPLTSDPIAHNYGALGANDDGYFLPGCFPASVPGPSVAGFPSATACRFNMAFAGYVDVPTDGNNGLNVVGPVTMTAWVQGSPADARFQSIAGRGDASYRFGLDGGSGQVRFADGNAGNGDVIGGFINNGQWHFVAGVWDGFSELIYIDGVLSATLPDTIGVPGSSSDFIIGGVPDYLPGRIFNGNVSQVAVFGSALSTAQIQGLYNSAGIPPYVITQPTNSIMAINSTGALAANASGTAPVTYRWYKGGSPLSNSGDISGVTTPTLTISPAALADAGGYELVITNLYGAITSAVATVTVVSGPIISPDLAATNEVFIGTPARLTVGLSGTAPFNNGWTFNGQAVADGGRVTGAHTPSLVISNAQPSDTGNYQFWSTNSLGVSHSSLGRLVVQTVLGFNLNGGGWTVNKGVGSGSSPSFVGSDRLQLTTAGAGGQDNSFFFPVPQYIGAFKAHFTYYDVNDGADGVCFVLQNSGAGVHAVGDGGGGMGVRGITNSFEVEIDLYNEQFAVNTNGFTHEAANGWPAGNPEFELLGTGDDVGAPGQTKDMFIVYDGNNLSLTWSNETSLASGTTNVAFGDIKPAVGGSTALVGFTGACGGIDDTQIIGDFSYIPMPPILTIAPDGSGGVLVSWPALTSYTLQQNSNLANPAGWTPVAGPYTTVSGPLYGLYQVHVTAATGNKFYRLAVTPP